MRQKKLFQTIFLLLAVTLLILPFLVSFNDVLTKLVERFTLYTLIQEQVVPVEVKMIVLLLTPFHLDLQGTASGFIVKGTFLKMTWNCIGWQSLLLLSITLITALRSGSYTIISQLETILFGLLGTFLINLFRLSFIILLFNFSRPLYAIVYHDYLAAIVTIIWLFFFWWFSYSFVLEAKDQGP